LRSHNAQWNRSNSRSPVSARIYPRPPLRCPASPRIRAIPGVTRTRRKSRRCVTNNSKHRPKSGTATLCMI
jgi:hypothetical protein